MARKIPRRFQVDLAGFEERVDDIGGGVQLGHPGPARVHHVLGAILVGRQTHRTSLDAQRDVLAHQRNQLALGGEVECARQDPGIVGVGAEAHRQHRGIGVIQLNVQ